MGIPRKVGLAAVLFALMSTSVVAQPTDRLPPAPAPKGLPPAPTPTKKYPGMQKLVIDKATDPRIKVDVNDVPWRGIGRMQAGGASCTAALIRPALLLTAAHCVFNGRTRQYFKASELHFKLGYDDGTFSADARGTNVIIPDEYDPVLNIGTVGNDWALVELDTPIGTPDRLLPLRETTPSAGAVAALGGYANDYIETLMADRDCRVTGLMFDADGLPLIRHNCTATQGVSGAPLLIKDSDEWVIGGIEVVGSQRMGGAAVLHDVFNAIEKLESTN